jgi:hypothetical protein
MDQGENQQTKSTTLSFLTCEPSSTILEKNRLLIVGTWEAENVTTLGTKCLETEGNKNLDPRKPVLELRIQTLSLLFCARKPTQGFEQQLSC